MDIRVVQFGCGPIGCSVVQYVSRRQDIQVVGAIDIDRNLVSRDLGEVAGFKDKLGVSITDDAEAVLSQTSPDAVLHTTVSSLKEAYAQLVKCMKAGANVVSTCEELTYPFWKEPELSAKINEIAKANDVTVLATGVNPGFLMDTWPLFMTGVCQQVDAIKSVRIQNAAQRRAPFQKKIGAGRTLKEFDELVAAGTLRHVGLAESIAMIASGLDWELDEITESIEPLIAKSSIKTEFVAVEPGQVAGVRQLAKGIKSGKELVTLLFEASVDAAESYDALYVSGTPNLEVVIRGGTHGDIATAAIVVNSVHRVVNAPPGFITMKDLPIVCAPGASI